MHFDSLSNWYRYSVIIYAHSTRMLLYTAGWRYDALQNNRSIANIIAVTETECNSDLEFIKTLHIYAVYIVRILKKITVL